MNRSTLTKFAPITAIVGILSLSGIALAAGSLSVSPSSGLSNGQSVSVSGSGLAASNTGSIVECNNDPNQPTMTVAGNQVPVSCTNPLLTLVNTDKNGDLAASSFSVKSGTVGPPASGNDTSGASGATDAANYPCPPTAAQIAAGDSCVITFGDAAGDDVSQDISFASTSSAGSTSATTQSPSSSSSSPSASSTPSSSSTTKTAANSSSSTAPTSLTNTGPGNVVAIFLVTVIFAGLARHFYLLKRANSSN